MRNYIKDAIMNRFEPEIEARVRARVSTRFSSDNLMMVTLIRDPDGNIVTPVDGTKNFQNLSHFELQERVWDSYREFPYVRSDVDRKVNMITGKYFGFSSTELDVQEFLDEMTFDHRNILWWRWSGWILRMLTEGELFLLLTIQSDGMPVIQVLEPGDITGASDGSGIFTHPDMVSLPLYYSYRPKVGNIVLGTGTDEIIPSINILYGDYENVKISGLDEDRLANSRAQGRGKYKPLKNFYRFIIHWPNMNGVDEAKRDTSYLRAVLKYINYYKESILWSLDYRKSLASWAQKVKFSNDQWGMKAYRLWMKMTDEERTRTGLTKPPQPGDRLFLMPGMDCDSMSNNTGKDGSGENIDVRNLLASGMDSLPDILTADTQGASYASIRETRNPFADVVEALQTKFSRLFKYAFIQHVLFIKSLMDESFKFERKVEIPVGFSKSKKKVDSVEEEDESEVKTTKVKRKVFHLVEVNMPVLNVQNMEAMAKGLLGSKHGSLDKSLGIPPSVLAERMGFQDYHKLRLQNAYEEEIYPELMDMDEQEQVNEGKGLTDKEPKDTSGDEQGEE